MENSYKRTVAGSIGAGVGAIVNGSGRKFFIIEHKTDSILHQKGESQKIIVDEIELGRDSSCQIRFEEDIVSRHHAAIIKDGEGWKIVNLSQTNPTYVNGQQVVDEWHLNSGDEIRLSSKGPVMGFIIPQGDNASVNSIGITERMNLFRKQALRPYKAAITILFVILCLAIAGLVLWNVFTSNKLKKAENDRIMAEQQQLMAEKTFFADIQNCFGAIYYIKMNSVTVYNSSNNQIVSFNTEDIVGGTGFILEDGKFITARRVVEPWYYYTGKIGVDQRGFSWRWEDIQALSNSGSVSVVAQYSAYSPNGTSFKFMNTDMTHKSSRSYNDSIYERNTYTIRNKTVSNLLGKNEVYVYRHDNYPESDWASMAKKDQLAVVKGLKFNSDISLDPEYNTEVHIVGYPRKEGFVDSQELSPVDSRNGINVGGLNDMQVIEMSSRRYQVGNDGAPVLQLIDGNWTVIGILSHTDSADRDVAVPIGNL